MEKFDLNSFLPYQVNVLASRMSRSLEARYRNKFGITVSEWRILVHLHQDQAGLVSTRDIQQRVDMHKSRVSRAAKKLEGSGYIIKRPTRPTGASSISRLPRKGTKSWARSVQSQVSTKSICLLPSANWASRSGMD